MGTVKKKISNKLLTGGVFAYNRNNLNTNISYKEPSKLDKVLYEIYTKARDWYTTPIKTTSTAIGTGGYPLPSKTVYTSPRDISNAFSTTGGIMLSALPTPYAVATGAALLAPEVASLITKPTWQKAVSTGIEAIPMGKSVGRIIVTDAVKKINNYNSIGSK